MSKSEERMRVIIEVILFDIDREQSDEYCKSKKIEELINIASHYGIEVSLIRNFLDYKNRDYVSSSECDGDFYIYELTVLYVKNGDSMELFEVEFERLLKHVIFNKINKYVI